MKWIFPLLAVISIIFAVTISLWRIDLVKAERELLRQQISEEALDWVDNYFLETALAVQIFAEPKWNDGDYIDRFRSSFEQRLRFWRKVSLLPELIKEVIIEDGSGGTILHADIRGGVLSGGVSSDSSALFAAADRNSGTNPFDYIDFPILTTDDQLMLYSSSAGRRCLIILDYDLWRGEFVSAVTAGMRESKLGHLYEVFMEDGGQELADRFNSSDEQLFPLTMITIDSAEDSRDLSLLADIPEIFTDNAELRYSLIARADISGAGAEIPEAVFQEAMEVRVENRAVWGVLRINESQLTLTAVRMQLGWIFLSLCGSVLLIVLIFILYFYNKKASLLVRDQQNFIANVSHELRTPLAVICNAGANLRQGFVTGEKKIGQYGRMISDEGERLSSMVESILLYSGFQLGKSRTELIEISEFAAELAEPVDFLCRQKGIVFEAEVEEGVVAEVDREGFRSAFSNLLMNAVNHGGSGGRVAFRLGYCGESGMIELRVEDDGPGISRSEQRKIFMPFVRGADAMKLAIPGSGLGLSLVRKFAKLHGGRIEIESEPGEGAVFILRIPGDSND